MVVGTRTPERAGEADAVAIDAVFHALADATRRDIVRRSMSGEHSVSDLARRYPVSVAAVQKHVAVLERAGLITKHRRGRASIVHPNLATMQRAQRTLDGLETLWRERLERFGDVLTAAVLDPPTITANHSTSPRHPGGDRS